MVRRRALGDMQARAAPGGPADVRELATSINFLADESDRIQDGERERARLQAELRQASIRIREHLRAEAIIREAVTAIHEHLPVDFVWVGVVTGERLALARGDPGSRDGAADPIGHLPPNAIGWIRDIYRHRSSYRGRPVGRGHRDRHPGRGQERPVHPLLPGVQRGRGGHSGIRPRPVDRAHDRRQSPRGAEHQISA
jgi:hypothetical protein